jgi:hypothetical protein
MIEDYFKCTFDYDEDAGSICITHATQKDIDAFQWPTNIKSIFISYSWIDHIDIPDGVETFTCVKCLKSIIIPDSLRNLYLEETMVYQLDLPIDIKRVWAPRNYLRHITFRGTNKPSQLEVLNLKSNLLESLDIHPPSTLYEMDLRKNNLQLANINGNLLMHARVHENCIVDFY